MASQILGQIGPHWLECLDEQGVFYFNQLTQQSCDNLPPEVMASLQAGQPGSYAPPQTASYAPPPQQVNAPQGFSNGSNQVASYSPPPFQNYAPQQISSYGAPQAAPQMPSYTPPPQQMAGFHTPPPPYGQQPHFQAAQPTYQSPPAFQQPQSFQSNIQYQAPHPHQMQPPQPMYQTHPQQQQVQQMHMPQMSPAPVPQQAAGPPALQPADKVMQFGEWAVYQDNIGRFYMHLPTGQQFENPPPQLMQAFEQHRDEQDREHFEKLQQIELEKRRIDERLMQKTQALHQQFMPM